MTRLTGDKPENCGVLSHHSNNKTKVHNLLTVTLLLLLLVKIQNVDFIAH